MANKEFACVLYYTDSRYDELSKNTIDSFLKFNGDECDLYCVNHVNIAEFNNGMKYYEPIDNPGIMQYIYAYEIMLQFNYKKMIVLGCDTIVCSRLDEFLDDSTDVLASLNYPIRESTQYWSTPISKIPLNNGEEICLYDHSNINADVVCFNNPNALKKVIDLSISHYTHFSNQGGLNELAWADGSYKVMIVDAAYPLSKISYNVRSKGVPRTSMIRNGILVNCSKWGWNPAGFFDGDQSPIKYWYVKDNKLYTKDHKHIKCFHFAEGLGGMAEKEFNELVNDFKMNWFNDETINFFINECNCKEFFKERII
jgi:hypothetical protein